MVLHWRQLYSHRWCCHRSVSDVSSTTYRRRRCLWRGRIDSILFSLRHWRAHQEQTSSRRNLTYVWILRADCYLWISNRYISPLPFCIQINKFLARKFVEHPNLGWRYCFYLAIICNGIAIILLFFCYHPPTFRMLHMEGKTKLQQFKELDFAGVVLMTAGIVLLLLGISWGGVDYPWSSARPIATIVLGALLLIGFGFYGMNTFCPPPLVVCQC